MLKMDINKIFTLMNDRAPFISLVLDLISIVWESEANLKIASIKQSCFEIVSLCVQKFNQAPAVQTMIMQNLRYSNFLAEHMATLLCSISDQYLSEEIFRYGDLLPLLFKHANISREIGAVDFLPDDKVAKEFAKFLISVSILSPKETLRSLSVIQCQLDSDVSDCWIKTSYRLMLLVLYNQMCNDRGRWKYYGEFGEKRVD